MDRPRLRPLEGYPTTRNGQPFLALRDPSGVTDAVATLPPMAVAVVQLCDGESTLDEICTRFFERYRQRLTREALGALLAQLDEALLLDSERFRNHAANVFAEFARLDARPPLMAGRSYPKEAEQLAAQLDGFFAPPLGPGRPAPTSSASSMRPKAIVAPHVDFARGGAAYAWAYKDLAASSDRPPDLVVVLGTDHIGVEQPFSLTRKHYDTPLGRVATDVELVEKVAEAGGGLELFKDEHHHRGEHSLEFQMVWLRHIYGARADGIKALPILCGSLSDHIERGGELAARNATTRFLDALATAIAGRDVLFVAAADLAHVGPRYGDAEPLSDDDKRSLEKRDRETLAPVLRGDPVGWFDEIRRERDQRRVCGLSPVYAMLRLANPGPGRLEVYAQCPAEQGSVVSIASIVY
jgi:AmmeMemoRadiSam system protein B